MNLVYVNVDIVFANVTECVVVKLADSSCSLTLEIPQGEKLHNFFSELRRTRQSTCRDGVCTISAVTEVVCLSNKKFNVSLRFECHLRIHTQFLPNCALYVSRGK